MSYDARSDGEESSTTVGSSSPNAFGLQNLSAFREVERKYKWAHGGPQQSGKRQKRPKTVTEVDLSEVIDLHAAEPHPDLVPVPLPAYAAQHPESPCLTCYAFKPIPGLLLFPGAVDSATQAELCRSAILQYGDSSLYPNLLSTHVKTPVSTSCYRPPMRWATIGFSYEWTTKTYNPEKYAPVPGLVRRVMTQLASAVFEAERAGDKADDGKPSLAIVSRPEIYEPQSGIVNFFPVGGTMMAHQDAAEEALTQPLLSLSLGSSAIFLMGTTSMQDKPHAFLLRSGDLAAFAGPARLAFHGVPRILDDCPPYLSVDDITEEEQSHYDDYVYYWNMKRKDGTVPPLELSELSSEQRERYWRLAMKHMRVNINVRQVYEEPCPFLFSLPSQ